MAIQDFVDCFSANTLRNDENTGFRKSSIAQSYGVSESSAYRTSRWGEDTLIKHPDFALPGKKALQKSDMQYEVILIDATETPIERPKKNRSISTQVRRNGTRSKVSL